MSESGMDEEDRCPKCEGPTTFLFGMAFGGESSGYSMCLMCDWVEKPDSDGRVSCLHQLNGGPDE